MIMVVLLVSVSPACSNEMGSREFLPGIITGLKVTQTPRTSPTITTTKTVQVTPPPQTVTVTPTAPGPAPIFGYGSAYVVDTTFSWDSYPYAKRYEIQLSKDNQFLSGVISKTIWSSHKIVWETPLDYSVVYYWRVKASTGKGKTDWAQSSFTSGELQTTVTNTVEQTIPPNTVTVATPPKTVIYIY
jgi:hypothetical protein